MYGAALTVAKECEAKRVSSAINGEKAFHGESLFRCKQTIMSANYPTQSASGETSSTLTTPSNAAEDTPAGLVLCGGAGRRMQGKDKGLLELGGQLAVTRTMNLLTPLCKVRYISANRHLDRYRNLNIGTVVPDQRLDYQGPLAGIEAVAPALACTALLVLPCDLPRLSAQVPERLLAALNDQPDIDVVYAQTAERRHYLCAAIRTCCLNTISAALDRQQRAVRLWYASLSTGTVFFSGALGEGFHNANRLQDLER